MRVLGRSLVHQLARTLEGLTKSRQPDRLEPALDERPEVLQVAEVLHRRVLAQFVDLAASGEADHAQEVVLSDHRPELRRHVLAHRLERPRHRAGDVQDQHVMPRRLHHRPGVAPGRKPMHVKTRRQSIDLDTLRRAFHGTLSFASAAKRLTFENHIQRVQRSQRLSRATVTDNVRSAPQLHGHVTMHAATVNRR